MINLRNITSILAFLFFLIPLSAEDVTRYVSPMIGADGGGNVFPGACMPYGMVKLGPDCGDLTGNAGWQKGAPVIGFSHTHLSGSGGGCKYGNILFMASTGDLNPIDYASPYDDLEAHVGLFSIGLTRYGIKARLSASEHAGLHEYEFPAVEKANVFVDLGKFLTSNEAQEFVDSEVRILSDTEIEGFSRVRGGWNYSIAYTVYFYAKFDRPADALGTWKEGKLYPGILSQGDSNTKTGAYFTFDTQENRKVGVKVGISYIGYQKARKNAAELKSFDVDSQQKVCAETWNDILSQVTFEGGSEEVMKIFYSSMYRIFMQPTDYTGENPLWISEEPYYGDYHAIWDIFRATAPFINLFRPGRGAEMVQSLVDIAENDNFLPDARSSHWSGRSQSGSDADIMIADAYVKGLAGIDYKRALDAMLKSATVPPGGDERQYGRGGLWDYNRIGYVSTDYERSCSRTIEYSADDYAIATVAKGLGDEQVYDEYVKKSSNWENIWNPDIESFGFKGFCWPRNSDGSWLADPKFTVFTSGSWPDYYYETFSWEQSFYVPHDMASLIRKCGGKEEFTRRLDTFFGVPYPADRGQLVSGHMIGMCQICNEPCFLVPSLYAYVGKPYKTAEIVRKIIGNYYTAESDGVPGNDDSGSMGAWYAFHTLGFFPIAGQDIYIISSPVFPKTVLSLENGAKFTVIAKKASDKNIYVQSAKLNGQPLDRCWLKHEEIIQGGTLEFVMGPQPSSWAEDAVLPPSLSAYDN